MEYIGKRISIRQKEDELSIVILSTVDTTKKRLLGLWCILWTICGVLVLSQYFNISDKDTKVGVIVWLGFWAYFEYKIFKAYLWRRSGLEKIKLKAGKLSYKRDVNGRGKVQDFQSDFIKDLRLIELNNSFSDLINSSYWMIAGERIAFDYYGKEIRIGLQLSNEEAKALLARLQKGIK